MLNVTPKNYINKFFVDDHEEYAYKITDAYFLTKSKEDTSCNRTSDPNEAYCLKIEFNVYSIEDISKITGTDEDFMICSSDFGIKQIHNFINELMTEQEFINKFPQNKNESIDFPIAYFIKELESRGYNITKK